MDKEEKETKSAGSEKVRGSGEKPKIKPHPKITPTQKSNEGVINDEMKKKLDDLEKELEERKTVKTNDEEKTKQTEEVRKLSAMAENICYGREENSEKSESERVKLLYDMCKNITKETYDEQMGLLSSFLEYEQCDRLMDIVLGDVNREENTIHKLKIIIRDLQDKTPKINDEVKNFVDAQSKWRKEKEEEFQKSIGTIRSQMNFAGEDSAENEMMTKYNELCNYVETMKKEVESFKEAREKLVADRDEKIKELEDTKNKKLNESKENIEEKINALKHENESFKKQLPVMRKEYTNHKNESKKLVAIIEANNKKKRDYKDQITLLNNEIFNLKTQNKDKQSLVDNLMVFYTDKNKSLESLKKELEEVTKDCNVIQKLLIKKD